MVSHAAAGDPRVRNNDPRTVTSTEEDIRKRQASQSPARGNQPALKKPNQQFQQPAPPTTGVHSRQSSMNVNDPRRSNLNSPAGSRRNSTSTNTNGINGNAGGSMQLNGQNGHDSPGGAMGSSGASTPQTPIAPVAVMSSAAPAQSANTSPDLQAAIFNALMGVSEQASELALKKLAFKQANIALNKAKREYDNSEKHFAQFPAMKEQNITNRSNMQKRYDESQKRLHQAQAIQAQVVGTAATTIAGMQQRGGIDPSARSDLQSAKSAAGRVNKCLERVAATEQKLTSLSTRVDDTRALVEQQGSNAPQPTTEQFAKLEARVNEAHALFERSQSSALQQPPAMPDLAELTELKERVDALEHGQDDQVEILGGHADAKVANVTQWAQAEIDNLQANIDQANATQHANAQTINELLSSVENLRSSVEQNAPHGPFATGEVLEALGQRIDVLALEVKNMQPAKPPSPSPAAIDPNNPLGLKPFKPVHDVEIERQPPPKNPTIKVLEERPAVGVKWEEWIENHIGALRSLCASNTTRLDNVSTDEIHDAMMRVMREKYNKEYPDLLTWQATVNEVKATHARDIGQLKAIHDQDIGQLKTVHDQDVGLLKAIHDQDIGQLRTDATTLTQRVQAHEDAVAQGQQKFAEIDREYKAISQDVLQLQGAQQNALERALNNATS